jgi:hypothetical protein
LPNRLIKRFALPLLACLWLSISAVAADNNPFLPKSFAGWTQTGMPETTNVAGKADSAYPAVLTEYGFADAETATYTRDDGRKLTIKAARFKDATGAYGAFTFYRQPQMKAEEIGTEAASANDRILFFRSNVLVDASFDRVTAMSAAELRELAAALPAAQGSAGNLPTVPQYLPAKDAAINSARYILGPQALLAVKAPLTPEQIDFNVEPEVLTQDYSSSDGPLTLTIIDYPTPQIAAARLRALQSIPQSSSSAMLVRRSGPLVAVVTGATGSDAAHTLVDSVNYEANVTWDEATSVSKRNNIGNLIVAVFSLIGILLLFAIIFGVFFGGIKVLLRRAFPARTFGKPEDAEFIQLHLK